MIDKRSLLSYGDSTLSPPISSTEKEIAQWKKENNKDSKKYFKTRYNEILEEAAKLQDSIKLNQMMDNSEIGFAPIVGEEYHLYQRQNNSTFVSMISPKEWSRKDIEYLGTYKVDSQNVWTEIK